MSTFGKKALVWWDYENHTKENATRFSHTSLDIQKAILEKWYPIGTRFTKQGFFGGKDANTYKITDHVLTLIGYQIKYDIFEYKKATYKMGEVPLNPVSIMVIESDKTGLKRDYKIEKLLKWNTSGK
jgi:hypothetical protein